MRRGRKWTDEQRMKFKATMAARNGRAVSAGHPTTNVLDEMFDQMWSKLSTEAKRRALLHLIEKT